MNTDFAAQNQLSNMQGQMANTKAYTDLASLEKIKLQAQDDNQGALRAVAQQFESIFMNMVLKSMRNANEVFSEEGFLSNEQSNLYRDMYDQQISLSMTSGPGLGMADMLVKQLGGFVDRHQQMATVPGASDEKKPLPSTQQQGLQTYKSLSE